MAQSVLLVIPSYFMQTMLIPKGLCEEIERMVRQFVWGSSSSGRKVALVVGDGRNIKCWRDPWIPNVGSLVNLIPGHSSLNLGYLLSDIVAADGKSPLSTGRVLSLCSNLPGSWVYLNTYGSVRLEDGSVAAKGVVRN
ncbi:hypothetical protein Goklo_026973 [Gossypium klotzschianum]|uniref:Uncharacterized protein n=1 Tax=Gossypium klotzschianum TaxID=34286 RepID=A0A7J8TWL5_9ROSI|nr:hypothetical protein [Gossypium klotzschianum]